MQPGEPRRFDVQVAGRHTYNFRTASAEQRGIFDAWARSAGLLEGAGVEEQHAQQPLVVGDAAGDDVDDQSGAGLVIPQTAPTVARVKSEL